MAPDQGHPPRFGVLGGTFDPFHMGHLVVAQDVYETLALDRIFFVPAGTPPHKRDEELTSAPIRVRMVEAAVGEDARFQVLELEVRRPGPSYTVDTLTALRDEHPEAAYHLILGADQWEHFGSWHRPRRIPELAKLVLMTRNGDRPSEVDPGFEDGSPPPFREVPVTRMDISSTQIRDRRRAGRSVRYLVPEGVRRIIEARELYL